MKSWRVILLGLLCTCAQPAFAAPPWPADRKALVERQEAGNGGRPVRTPADWARRREQILLGMQRVMGPLPEHWRKLPLDLKVLEEVRLPGVTRRKIAYRADPYDVVTAYLLIPDEHEGRKAAVLCLHQTIEIGKDEPADAFLDRALRRAPSAAGANSTGSPRLDQGSRNTGPERNAPAGPPACRLAPSRGSEETARVHPPLFRLGRSSVFRPWEH